MHAPYGEFMNRSRPWKGIMWSNDDARSQSRLNITQSIISFRRKSTKLSTATAIVPIISDDDGEDDLRGLLRLNLLHSPSVPLIDFIFIHGLGGGSRKTWTKTSLITHCWPQGWLPNDPAFKNGRVLSFGYDSNWIKGKGIA